MKPRLRHAPFILASASPRRRRLMAGFPWPFWVRPSRVNEPSPRPGVRPDRYVLGLARRKARHVARSVTQGLVLGADTVVYQKGKIFGKPASRRSAKRMLAQLAGAWHTVYTGLVLAAKPGDHEWSGIWRTRVKMRRLSPQEIEYWSGRHHDKAGAYAAQDRRNPFVEKMRGDFDNVVGLPRRGLRVLLARARRAGYAPSPRPSHLSK